jgi:dTDP-4-dehydrorhamnose 3,5-epimerase
MGANVQETNIKSAFLVEPQKFGDDRGFFTESYRRDWIPGAREVIQTNRSSKSAGALAGFHYHLHQSDYWYVPFGEARSVIYDMRIGSPTEGEIYSVDLTGDNNLGLYIPPGVAHGFSATTDMILTYLVDNYYNQADELGVAWDDKTISAEWSIQDPILSVRDSANPTLDEIDITKMPVWPLRT